MGSTGIVFLTGLTIWDWWRSEDTETHLDVDSDDVPYIDRDGNLRKGEKD